MVGSVISASHPFASCDVDAVVATIGIASAFFPVMSSVGVVGSGMTVVVIAGAINHGDGIVPCIVNPSHRVEEIVQRAVETVLPVKEHVAQVLLTISPVRPAEIGGRSQRHEVVKIDGIDHVILLWSEVKFVCHLVSEEVGVLTCLCVAHRKTLDCAESADDAEEE